METNGNNSDQDLGDKKWNNLQKSEHVNDELNEGFSTENIPDDYNPSEEKLQTQLRSEFETDEDGNQTEVKRARFVDPNSPKGSDVQNPNADNKIIENKESLKNRDRNYDIEANRYPASHPDNYENRGNIESE